MPFEGMVVKTGKSRSVGSAFGALKPGNPTKFREWVPQADLKGGTLEEWASRITDELVSVAETQSVIVMIWCEGYVITVVRGEFFEEADVKEEFLNYVNFLCPTR